MLHRTLSLALLLAAGSEAALAQNDHQTNTCWWRPDAPPGPMVFVRDLGTVHVPRDAEIGRQLGGFNVEEYSDNAPGARILCSNLDSYWTFSFDAVRPLAPITTVDHSPILQTNIPGIGARIQLTYPFDGRTDTAFHPIGRNPPLVPFKAYHNRFNWIVFEFGRMRNFVTLYKIGDIAPGIHRVDTPMFTGHLDEPNIGHVLTYRLQVNLVNSECSLAGNAVSANPVQLGEHGRSAFTRPGFTTPAVPFQIRLSACEVDPEHNTFATIELDGVQGSYPIGSPLDGIFSLTSDSSARGMGIRILNHNGTPVALNREVPLIPLVDGTTILNFSAQFIQTEPAGAVHAGLAKGALNFTIRYR